MRPTPIVPWLAAASCAALCACTAGLPPCDGNDNCLEEHFCGSDGYCTPRPATSTAAVAISGVVGHSPSDVLTGPFRVRVEASASTGVAGVELAGGGAALAPADDSAPPVYLFDVPAPSGQGSVALVASVTSRDDKVAQSAALQVHFDNQSPILTLGAAAPSPARRGAAVTVSVASTEALASVGGEVFLSVSSTDTKVGTLSVVSGSSTAFVLGFSVSPVAPAGAYKLTVTGADAAGNAALPRTVPLTVLAPFALSSTSATSAATAGGQAAGREGSAFTVRARVPAAVPLASPAAVFALVDAQSASRTLAGAVTASAAGPDTELSITDAIGAGDAHGLATVQVLVTDLAGNQAGGSVPLAIDKVPPALSGLAAVPAVADVTSGSPSGTITVAGNANEPIATAALVATSGGPLGGATCLCDGLGCSGAATSRVVCAVPVPAVAAPASFTVAVRTTDAVGNLSADAANQTSFQVVPVPTLALGAPAPSAARPGTQVTVAVAATGTLKTVSGAAWLVGSPDAQVGTLALLAGTPGSSSSFTLGWTVPLNGATAGTHRFSIAAAGLGGGPASATSTAFTVDLSSKVAFAQQPFAGVSGAALGPPFVVEVQDAAGHRVTTSGTPVSVTLVAAAGATLGGTTTRQTVAGVVTFDDLTVDRAATGYQLAATSAGLAQATSQPFSVVAGPAARLAFVRQPTTVAARWPMVPSFVVELRDAAGNATAPAATVNVTVGLIAPPAGVVLQGTTTRAAVAGQAEFGDLRLDQPWAGYKLRATSGALASADAAPFDVLGVAVAAGGQQTAVVRPDGSLWSWGIGYAGDGTAGVVGAPALLRTGWASVAVSPFASVYALRPDGTLWAWGDNAYGQLADGFSSLERTIPLQVGGGWTAVATGYMHAVALRPDGTLWAWGANYYGQLGVGGNNAAGWPTQVGSGYAAAWAGYYHTVALKTDGTLWAWGQNSQGQLGNASSTPSTVPVLVGSGFASAAAGNAHTVAVKTDGTLWAWGANSAGQLGNATTTPSLAPVLVGGGFAAVAAGASHTVALKTDGTLWAFGSNTQGQLGIGNLTYQTTPVQVGADFLAAAAGSTHTVALRADGTVAAWGGDAAGQLGAWTPQRLAPRQVGAGFTWVDAGSTHTLALKTGGALWAWGVNSSGQLGNGTTTPSGIPVQVGAGFASASAGGGHSAAVTTDGALWSWGNNSSGQLGNGGTAATSSPTLVGTGYAKVSAGSSSHTVAVQQDGTLLAWGLNNFGQLGTGTLAPSFLPAFVGTGFASAAAGGNHTLAVGTDGTLWAWGLNSNGQFGNSSSTSSSLPVSVGSGYAAVSAYGNWSAAIKGDATLWVWGFNASGLGNGLTSSQTPVSLGDGWASVVLGGNHAVAVKTDGSLWAWGDNSQGQLGDGTALERRLPIRVGGGFAAASAGGAHTAALKTDGTLWTWGNPSGGRLGDGNLAYRLLPGPVVLPATAFVQPAGTVAVGFTVDDTANKVYTGPGQLQWKGAMAYDAPTRRAFADATWQGPWPPLYDDGPWASGGHEPAGAVAGDNKWGATVFITPPASGADSYAYGLSDHTVGDGWIWVGVNGSFSVAAGATAPITAPGMVLPKFGTTDLKLVIDVTALSPTSTTWSPPVTVKGSAWIWGAFAPLDDGTQGDDVAGDQRWTLRLSNVVGAGKPVPTKGLLNPGEQPEFIFLFNGAEYRVAPGGAASRGGVRAYTKASGAATWGEVPVSVVASNNLSITVP